MNYDSDALLVAEKLNAYSTVMQVMINYGLNLENTDYSHPIQEINREAKKVYKIGEYLLEKGTSKDIEPTETILYSGSTIIEEEKKTEWLLMDNQTVPPEIEDCLESHNQNLDKIEKEEDALEQLEQAVDDYKLLTWSTLEYDLKEDVDYPSVERDSAEILETQK